MPPKNQRTCEHFLRGKCNYGSKCKFSHTRPSGGKSSSNGRKSNPGVSNNQANKSTRTRILPKGACRSFWENGTCDRPYECKFQHNSSKSGSAVPPSAPITASPSTASLDEGLIQRYAEAFSDCFSTFTLSPSHVQNQIMPFIQANSRFKNTQDMCQFAAMLGSANTYNSTWDIADGQQLFGAIGDPDGQAIHRIRDILVHRSVVTQDARSADLSFQRAYLPVLGYLSSSWVVKSTLRKNVNALYGVLDQNFDQVERVLQSCIEACMARKSFSDATVSISGLHVFRVVTKCLYEYATRFKNAVAQHPRFNTLVTKLVEWSNSWAIAVSASPPFKDPIAGWSPKGKEFAVNSLKKSISVLFEVVERAEGSTLRRSDLGRDVGARESRSQAVLDGIQMTYDGPGVHHEGGKPRHDNDHADVSKIEVVPTHAELTCPVGPYLPANLPGARHHLPGSSMERLVDIQFRLLREELIAPIRSSLTHVLHDLEQPQHVKTQLDAIFAKFGGLYKANHSGSDSVMFSIYTGVNFKTMECDGRRGLAVDLTFDTPRGRASDPSPAKRSAYWESVGKRRLMQGGLLGLLWIPPSSGTGDIRFYLGTVTSHLDDLRRSARLSANRLFIKVSFFDPEVDIRILNALQQRRPSDEGTKILVEAPIMFESIRPFLETLKSRPPTSIPFSRYIAHNDSGDLSSVIIDPPAYVTPRFAFNLDCLFDCTPPVNLSLQPRDELSVQNARNVLKARSRLDPSQADAMINALTSEVSLIQGPPGTGKSFTGVELLRVLISNRIRPILLIAFTNHALDNIINHVLDKGLTKNIIRLGSRSSEEAVAEYTLETIMRAKPRMQADKSAGKAYAKMMTIQEEMSKLMFKVVGTWTKEQDLRPYLQSSFPNHHASLFKPPSWIRKLYEDSKEWQTSTKKGSQRRFMADFWRFGEDIAFLTPPPPSASANDSQGNRDSRRSDRKSSQRFSVLDESNNVVTSDESNSESQDWLAQVTDHFAKLKINRIPPIPATNRSLDQLLNSYDVWSMSTEERKKLYTHWHNQIRELGRHPQKAEFKRLKKSHAEARNTWSDMMDQGKQDLLSKADLIGCTTNGAAKLTTLLQSVAPKVLIVEEAGQVLEAHTIASLVPSIEHLILIGDPLQLRPTIENYQLSMDNTRTGKVFRFDESLMERLSRMGLRMSQLDVQRRMRPEIADLVRYTLYPNLKDHTLVQAPPSVRGMAKDVFFLDHRHAEESGGDDSVSKTNTYEAKMIKDLVLYFLKQGKYTKTGDIVVLCAYIGQLTKVRKLLSSEVATVIDERDAVQLINREDNDDAAELVANPTEKVQVAHRVLLRTVDNFQGEEGTIVILSLVRNSGESSTAGKRIGFLKSMNRVNVALSRAREGLYILGNADDLVTSGSKMWTGVIDQLRRNEQIGPAFPLCCSRHPATLLAASKPGQIAMHAPEGGCLEDCNSRLNCGHHCPLKCHPDDPQHLAIRCALPCVKFCSRGHPCNKACSAPCGLCDYPIKFQFPCGHVAPVQCHRTDNPANLRCTVPVQKVVPRCGHPRLMACSDDASEVSCNISCGASMPCCGRICQEPCGNCQTSAEQNASLTDLKHADHPCEKMLYCGHTCSEVCTIAHECADSPCQDRCRQKCQHQACDLRCTDPCAPCMEPCGWTCDHQAPCPVVCGAPCARLPCDRRCNNDLDCGHRCPSVCGEPCEGQVCPLCADEAALNQVVDMIGRRKLDEIDPHGEELAELIITLACGHIFTVETLDGICELEKYYTRDDDYVWASIAPPPHGFRQLPTCPNCREPIKSLRYGRVYKRADLDMSEQNVATNLRRTLFLVHEGVAAFNAAKVSRDLEKALEQIPLSELPPEASQAEEELNNRGIRSNELLPVPSTRFDKNSPHLRPIPQSIKDAWVKATRRLIAYYERASKVAATTSSHLQAYESAVATLSQQYLDELEHSNDLPEAVAPEDMALGQARAHCGLPASPKADVQFRVEACWLTFNIRFHVVALAQTVAEILGKARVGEKVQVCWADMIEDIIYSVERDASMAIEVARESQSNRQIVRTALFLMEAQYQAFSHRVDRYLSSGRVDNLEDEAREGYVKAKVAMEQYSRLFREAMDLRAPDQQWLKDNYGAPAEGIVAKWAALITRLDGGYSPVADADKKEKIIKALMGGFLGLNTRGHFHQCLNGHLCVIPEHGGAKESRCPECNSIIG